MRNLAVVLQMKYLLIRNRIKGFFSMNMEKDQGITRKALMNSGFTDDDLKYALKKGLVYEDDNNIIYLN